MSSTGFLTMDERLFIHCYYFTTYSAVEIAAYLKIPVSRVKNYLKAQKMNLTVEQRKAKQSVRMLRTNNSAQFDEFIKDNCLKLPIKQIARQIGKSGGFVFARYKVLGIEVPDDIKRKFIEDSYIKKGNIPPNKGKKLTAEEKAKFSRTFFKKGHVPHNVVEIGSERITKDGYIEVKIQDGTLSKNYKLKHRLVWERFNGPVPKGFNVQFKDRNRQNCTIDNLYIISRSEQLQKNGFSSEAIAKRFLKMSDEEIQFAKQNAPGLIEAKAAQMKLKQTLNKIQNEGKRSN